MVAMSTSSFLLNNGVEIPAIGLGVFQTPPDETADAVATALEVGYRHIDTAAAYFNETGVGEGIRRSGLDGWELFIETKVWISDYGYDQTLHAFDKSARKLGIEQIDLLILHQALPGEFDLTLDAYRALEKLLADGAVRAIGVSNFMPEPSPGCWPRHRWSPRSTRSRSIPTSASPSCSRWTPSTGSARRRGRPIGGITFYPGYGEERRSTLQDPTIGEIAAAHGKTPAQVMLRWHIQQGRQV